MTTFHFRIFVGPTAIAEVADRLLSCGINVKCIGQQYIHGTIGIDIAALEPANGWGTWTDRDEDTRAAIERHLRSVAKVRVELVEWEERP